MLHGRMGDNLRKLKENVTTSILNPKVIKEKAVNARDRNRRRLRKPFQKIADSLTPDLPETIAAPPAPDDELARKRKQRAAQRKYAKAGRSGTMLTSDSGTLG